MFENLNIFLKEQEKHIKSNISEKNPEMKENISNFDIKRLSISTKSPWLKVENAIAVFADLKNSSLLSSSGIHSLTLASIYQGSSGALINVFKEFKADYIQTQGDGVLAVFIGKDKNLQAITAAITIHSLSDSIVTAIDNKNIKDVKTGYRVGISSGPLLVKKFGIPRALNQQDLVWAGAAVNYAVKASGCGDGLVVTEEIMHNLIFKNDFLFASCECSKPNYLWRELDIKSIKLTGYSLTAKVWCTKHGDEYLKSILNNEIRRYDNEDIEKARKKFELDSLNYKRAIALKETHRNKNTFRLK